MEVSAKAIKEELKKCIPYGSCCETILMNCEFFIRSPIEEEPHYCELLEQRIGVLKKCGINEGLEDETWEEE